MVINFLLLKVLSLLVLMYEYLKSYIFLKIHHLGPVGAAGGAGGPRAEHGVEEDEEGVVR